MKTISKVLLVDDEPMMRRIGAMSLERVGTFTVVLASNGLDAMAVAEREKPDLILLDVMMPDMDGLATLHKLRASEATSAIPVIFLTGKTEQQEVDEYLAAGAVGVIPKPFDPMTLPSQIHEILSTKTE